jgi:hypothetical protein
MTDLVVILVIFQLLNLRVERQRLEVKIQREGDRPLVEGFVAAIVATEAADAIEEVNIVARLNALSVFFVLVFHIDHEILILINDFGDIQNSEFPLRRIRVILISQDSVVKVPTLKEKFKIDFLFGLFACFFIVNLRCNIGLIQVYDIKSLIKRHLPYFCIYMVLWLQLQHRIRREVLVVIIFYFRRDVKNIA